MSIDVSVDESIALITINRPDRLNAMDLRMERVTNRLLWETEDVKEGTSAFAQKRPAQFQGR